MKYMNLTKILCATLVFGSLGARAEHALMSGAGSLGIIPGEDASLAVLLGQGIDTITYNAKGHCVELGNLRTQSGNTEGRIAEFKVEEIRSETDLRERLGLSATVSMIAALYGNPSGRMNFVYESRVNTQNRYLLVKSRVANQLEIADEFTFKEDIQNLLRSTNGAEAPFVQACGNDFVYSRRTGVEFYALLEFLTITHEQARRFDLAAEGSYNGWRGVVDLDYALERFAGIAETRVKMVQLGGSRVFPQVGDLEEFARTYPAFIDASLSGAVALEMVTKDYGGVSPVLIGPDMTETRKRSVTMDTVAKNREKVEDLRRAIDYIRGNLNFYQYDRRVHTFDQWLTQLKEFSDANDDIASACLTGYWEWCSITPTHRLPDIQLPVRKIR